MLPRGPIWGWMSSLQRVRRSAQAWRRHMYLIIVTSVCGGRNSVVA